MIITTVSKKYPTQAKFQEELNKRLIIIYNVDLLVIGKVVLFRFNLTVPQDHIIEGYSLEETFKFFIESIYNPLIDNSNLAIEKFKREKKYILAKLNHLNQGIYNEGYYKLIKYLDKDEIYFQSIKTKKDI